MTVKKMFYGNVEAEEEALEKRRIFLKKQRTLYRSLELSKQQDASKRIYAEEYL